MKNLEAQSPGAVEDIELRLLAEGVFQHYGYEFRNYAVASLKRRARVAMSELGCATISELQSVVLHDAAAFGRFLASMTVQVTSMFRDPEFYRTFRTEIVPVLRTYPSIRIWVPGCSTGEEAYSYAIILREEGLLERSLIYATDISPDALRTAAAGMYSLERMRESTLNHRATGAPTSLGDQYVACYDSASLDATLKRHVVFAAHSLATDAVFAEVQVVSCRNVLIYFEESLQERVLGLVHRSLCRRGFLGLGSRESLYSTSFGRHFTRQSSDRHWYQKA